MTACEILKKHFSASEQAYRIVLEHSRLVADKALVIASSSRLPVDLTFIEEAALLHDIGIVGVNSPRLDCHGQEPYIRHGIIGRKILESEGLPRHAMVCERHIGVGLTPEDISEQGLPLPLRHMTPVSDEEKIICLADLFYSKRPEEMTR